MRQLIKSLVAVVVMVPSFSWALSDQMILNAYDRAQAQIVMSNSLEERVAKLEEFRHLVNLRLNSIDLPEDVLMAADNDPRIESFRSLNEFEGYLDLISMRKVHEQSCARAEVKVVASSAGKQEGYVSQEARMALDLLKTLCAR